MQPIFKEMIQMWNDLGYPLPIEEGKYWLENHFVCGFTANGELHKLYKYKVADDLSIEITPYKMNKIKLSSSAHIRTRTIPFPIVIFNFFVLTYLTIDYFNNLTKSHTSFKSLYLHVYIELFADCK